MSFSVPRNLPNFESPQRLMENEVWGSTGRSRFSNGNGGAFAFKGSGKELPMYKDKPYNYPASKRRRSLKLWAFIVFLLVTAWFVLFGRSSGTTRKIPTASTLLSKFSPSEKGATTWSARRQEVVKAMEISWSGYEKHAWGMLDYIWIKEYY
jgi:mannosyl-oligosaccharide alpha-1,2-mannosidase